MRAMRFAIAIACFLLAGCGLNTMDSWRTNPATGRFEKKSFTNEFHSGVYLEGKEIGLLTVLDLQGLGALNSGDARARVTFYFFNFTEKPRQIELLGVQGYVDASQVPRTGAVTLPPNQKTRVDGGSIYLNDYLFDTTLQVRYRYAGETKTRRIKVERIAQDERQKFFGPGGKPPYEWERP